ncbi:hypothetical protein LCGC14_0509430 [marine sediment metagenome]|uniref:Uncharacterized protein n=1 Tax=marine sediment metagenome TaxID=412755 RepID=A0A0F9SK25_9ZZZZ|nr:hypothetical protein [bacterium]
MAKVWKYVVITIGLILILRLAGLPTGADPLFRLMGVSFNAAGNFENVTTTASGFYDVLFQNVGDLQGILITIVAATAGVIAGLLTRAKPENLILLPLITTTLVLFLMTTVSIMNYAISLGQTWVAGIIVIFLLPFTIGFVLALAEFFRGTD